MPNPVVEASQLFRRQLATRDKASMDRLIAAYARIDKRLQEQIDALVTKIGDDEPTQGELVKMSQYKALIRDLNTELQKFTVLTTAESEAIAEQGISKGSRDAARLMSLSIAGDASLAANFGRLPTATIESLLGFLDPEGELFKRLDALPETTTGRVADEIVTGVGLGQNPRVIARNVRKAFGGGLTQALRTVRTVQLWSYREASRSTYMLHDNIVEGWYWFAQIGDPRTCLSCVMQHGTLHPVTETLNDHYNGRCTQLPAIKGFPSPLDIEPLPGEDLVVEPSGKAWFERQSEETQRAAMGPARFEAWQAGEFELEALSGEQSDAVYGDMRVEQSLKRMLNG